MAQVWRPFLGGALVGGLLILGACFISDGLNHGGFTATMQGLEKYFGSNVTLAALISAILLISGWRRDRVSLSTTLNKQIQDYNLAILKDQTLAEQQSHGQLTDKSGAWIQDLYHVFYVLNMIRDGRLLRRWGFAHQNHLFEEDEMILMLADDFPEQLRYVLEGERGYNDAFKTAMLGILKERRGNDWSLPARAIRASDQPGG